MPPKFYQLKTLKDSTDASLKALVAARGCNGVRVSGDKPMGTVRFQGVGL